MKKLLLSLGLLLAVMPAIGAGTSVSSPHPKSYTDAVRADLANTADAAKGAALVGVKNGTAGRTLKDKLVESVSVIDYGADKTGVADSTAAIQAALDTCKPVRAPAGTYKIIAGLVQSCGAGLFGDGAYVTTLNVVGSGYAALTLRVSGATVEGIKFTSPTARTAGAYVLLDAATRANAVRSFILENAFVGIHIAAEAVITWVEDGEIINTAPATGVGILVEGGNDTFIARVVMDNPVGSQPMAGIRLRRTQAVWVTDTDVIHSGAALLIDPDGAASGLITWCFFKSFAGDLGSGPGVLVSPVNGATVKGLFFSNSWTSSNLRGVEITKDAPSAVDTVSFDDHTAFNNSQEGALVSAGNNIRFVGGRLAGNSQAVANTYSGVKIANGVQNFSLLGLRSGAQAGFAVSQKYGAEVGTGSDGYMVMGNDFLGNATAGYVDGSLTASGSHTISGNVGAKTRARGIATIASGANQITVAHGLAFAPRLVQVTPTNSNLAGLSFWTGSYTGSDFNINTSGNVGVDTLFAWEAVADE